MKLADLLQQGKALLQQKPLRTIKVTGENKITIFSLGWCHLT